MIDYEARFMAALFAAHVAHVRAQQAACQTVLPSPIGRLPGAPGSGALDLLGMPAGATSPAPAGAVGAGGERAAAMQSTYTKLTESGQTCSLDCAATGGSSL